MSLTLYARSLGRYVQEQTPAEGSLRVFYGPPHGKWLNTWLLRRKVYSALMGHLCDSPLSRRRIAPFAARYGIDMSQSAAHDYSSFNDFFTRALLPEARPFVPPPGLPCPADGRLRAWQGVDVDQLVQIKGISFSLSELIGDVSLAQQYLGGTFLTIRLAPVDYHRFAFFDEGMCHGARAVKGQYNSVHPIALAAIAKLYCQNARAVSLFASKRFGDVVYVEVGACAVGSIVQTYTPQTWVARGAEKGFFRFGGSTLLLFFQQGRVEIDQDILDHTRRGIECLVQAGERIGMEHNCKEERT